MMSEKPIPFSTEMVQAILEGRKTQTRRTRGLNYFNADPDFWSRDGNPKKEICRLWNESVEENPNPLQVLFGFREPFEDLLEFVKCPYGKVGDLLWVRETWCLTQPTHPESYHFGYRAGGVMPYSDWEASEKYDYATPDQWKPSIHMPKDAARIWLRITDVRVERLHKITEGDAVKEGIQKAYPDTIDGDLAKMYWSYTEKGRLLSAIRSFQSLWQSINGEDSWSANPWVWVVEFEVISTTGKP